MAASETSRRIRPSMLKAVLFTQQQCISRGTYKSHNIVTIQTYVSVSIDIQTVYNNIGLL